ncbi:MAG: DUF1700 domain-containing protein [Lachnospiraceae bacterium]|nr:DUF1700 domain-containing protein [Lachnospiraceae bacterium]
MNRIGFMSQLEGYLADVPAAEREEALQYYNDYFEDAGAENEQSVISSLGSPREIADNIKAELRGEAIPTSANPSDHAVTKYGQIVPAGEAKDEEVKKENTTNQGASGRAGGAGGACGFGGFGGFGGAGGAGGYGSYGGEGGAGGAAAYAASTLTKSFKGLPIWAWILIILGLIVILPTALGILSAIVSVAVGFLVTWFSLIVAFGATAFALIVSGIVVTVVAVMCFPVDAAVAMLVLGGAMLVTFVGLLFLMLTVVMAGRATPAIFRGIKWFFQLCWRGIKTVFDRIK